MTDLRTLLAVGLSILVVGFFHARADGPVNPTDTSWMQSQMATMLSAMGKEQATTTTTDASGNWSVTWNSSFTSASSWASVVDVGKVAGQQPISCNKFPATQTANSISGDCRQNVVAVNGLLGLTISLAPVAPPTGTVVSVIGREKTQ